MYNPYQPIGPDNQPDNTVQTGWTRVETASADNPQSESPAPPPAAYVPWAAAPQPPAPREKSRRDRRKSDGISHGALQCPNSARSRRKQGEHRQTAGKEISS